MTIQQLHQIFTKTNGICTDTRNIVKGTIFFALKGDSFNGNQYASQAMQDGCSYAIVDEVEYAKGDNIFLVDSVLQTLQDLANFHRKQFNIPIIGITGSNGKTTTKELIGEVLQQKFEVLITQGNLNNHLGVPFTLLNLNKSHEIAVIEMGANKPGDIKELVDIAEPTHGIITNIGTAHIEGFGSLEGVVKTKTELYDFIEANNGTIFINNDDTVLLNHLPGVETITYGKANADITGELIDLTPYVNFKWKTEGFQSNAVQTHLVGEYNFINFLAAISIGVAFGVENQKISNALGNYIPSNNRSQVQKTDRNTLIVDCYNANPTSMASAINSFIKISAPHKLLILGDMLELGNVSTTEHQAIVDLLSKNNLKAILIGDAFNQLNAPFPSYKTTADLISNENLSELKNHFVLLKGSRGIKLEELINLI